MGADWDVVIVGRSYGGLSAALTLGRARRSVLLIGVGGPRNESVPHTHGMLTRDGASPSDLIAVAESELVRYPTIQTVTAHVGDLADRDGVFTVSFGDRRSTASAVILATGANDNPPPIPGLVERWGRGVYTCPYCDGYENADVRIGVFGENDIVSHTARLLRNWSDSLTIFNGEVSAAHAEALLSDGIEVERSAVVRVIGDDNSVSGVEVYDGRVIEVGAIFLAIPPVPNSDLAVRLDCAMDAGGFVIANAAGQTSRPNVWAVGDVTSPQKNMTFAIAEGIAAAASCNSSLAIER